IGILALALLLHWALVRSRLSPGVAALITILVCSMPAFQVAGSWAVLFAAPYAALLGGGASILAVSAVDVPRAAVTDRLMGAVGLFLAALLIYQPAAMFFWVFLAVALLGALTDEVRSWRLVRVHAAVAGAGLLLTFVIAKVVAHIARDPASPNVDRSTLTHDP